MRRARLTRADVVGTALALVDDGGARGFGDLTLAAVAGRLGIAVPSLYKHVDSLADLRREITVASVNGLTAALTEASVGRSGSDALRQMAEAYREFARTHPGRYAASQIAPDRDSPDDAPLATASGATVAVVSAVLRGCDVPPGHMVDAIRAVRASLHGFVSLELGGGFGLPDEVDASWTFLVRAIDRGIRG